jgi:hypothetical protein
MVDWRIELEFSRHFKAEHLSMSCDVEDFYGAVVVGNNEARLHG